MGHKEAVAAEIDPGDQARFWSNGEALARWHNTARSGVATGCMQMKSPVHPGIRCSTRRVQVQYPNALGDPQ